MVQGPPFAGGRLIVELMEEKKKEMDCEEG